MQRKLIKAITLFCAYGISVAAAPFLLQENQPPSIKIQQPTTHSTFKWGVLIPYSIQVEDKEDGNSAYDEINTNRVFLITKYVKNSAELNQYLALQNNKDHDLMVQMGSAGCFTCHKAKEKLIGPSFDQIAATYRNNPNALQTLTNRVTSGSTGIWSDEKMPPHPGLDQDQVQGIIRWILENNNDPYTNYYSGIEGAIKTIDRPKASFKPSLLVLTATYTDLGSDDQGNNSRQTQQTLILKSE